MLRRLVAQRAKTAREGVRLAGQLVERFGYIDSGRTYIICDPDEGWLFCVVNGKHWLAQRVDDNEVAMVANTYTIRQVDLSDKDKFLASDDIIEYAISRGWYDPKKDGSFDFAAVYANPASASHPSNLNRQRSGLGYVCAKPIPVDRKLPFSVIPQNKTTVEMITEILRHDNQGKSLTSSSMDIGSEGICRICSGATQTSFVAQLRRNKPLEIGIVYWMCLAPPRTSIYIPYYFGISDFPTGFRSDTERPSKRLFNSKVTRPFIVEPRQAFWTFSNFYDKVNTSLEMITHVRTQAGNIEREAFMAQERFEEAASQLYDKDKVAMTHMLTQYSKKRYLSSLKAMERIIHERR
jgi:dipeptidase